MQARNREERELMKKAGEHGQEHLFTFWDQLGDREKDLLAGDIRSVDFRVVEKAKAKMKEQKGGRRRVGPPSVIGLEETSGEGRRRQAAETGVEVIRNGRTAAFTAAGGQSSRLGIDYPKGVFPVTPVREKSLFQVHAEKILFLQEAHHVTIPWIIMVSVTNEGQTRDFFRSNDFFGLDREHVWFVVQGMNPAVSGEGKVLLAEKHRVFLSPNGHGGAFSALRSSGALDRLREQGRDTLFYFQVDNVLADVLDPVYVGYHVQERCDMSSKCVMKRDPAEKLGAFVVEDGKNAIVEYSEVDSVIVEGDEDRDRALRAGNVAIHVIDLGFAEQITRDGLRLPLHLAHKAVPHVDQRGNRIDPDAPNGYKIETFIFDALTLAGRTIIMETRREEEFSPLKNRTGEDSMETVERDQLLLFAGWMEEAGVQVPRNEDGLPRHRLEVSPRFAPNREAFVEKARQRGIGRVEKPTYIE